MTDSKRIWPRRSLICLALALITFALYAPALRHEFLDYDDQQYVWENSHVQQGLTWQSLAWAGNAGYASNWHPLTWVSHMLDCQMYGLKPWGHHLTNILLHVANTLLLFLVLNRLTGATWRSALVASLFAWHPTHVESVAWVAERKDVLCAFFFLLTIWCYAAYTRESGGLDDLVGGKGKPSPLPSPAGEGDTLGPASKRQGSVNIVSGGFFRAKAWYATTLFFFALALMSKPMVVTLPFVLLLLDFWPLRRNPWGRLVFEKIPFFTLTVAGCALTMYAQTRMHAVVSAAGLPLSQRMAHALVAYLHYFTTTFFPRSLAVYYPYELPTPVATIIMAVAVLGIITCVCLWLIRQRPWLLIGWLWFLGMLAPVIGLVQVGDQAWADRYTYLPSIGLFIMAAWTLAECTKRAAIPVAATACAVLIALTSVQLPYWKNTRMLFEHCARVTQRNYLAATVLGSILAREGKLDDAVTLYQQALSWKPGYAPAHFHLGNARDQQGRLDEAIAEYQKAVWFKPTEEQTHLLLAAAFAKKHDYTDAVSHYQSALRADPDSALAHNNLAKLLHTQGQWNEAAEHYSAALKLDPNLAQAHNNLGIVLLQTGKPVEAAAQLREALRLNPENGETMYNLALALNQNQQWAEAAGLFARTVPGQSTDPNAHYQFALALAHSQKIHDAMSHYAQALLIKQDFTDALDGLSWILATDPHPEFRNGPQAVGMAEQTCALTHRTDPEKLRTLAAAYAEVNRFSDAITTAQTALDLANKANRKDLATSCEAILQSAREGKPWREPTTVSGPSNPK